MVFIGKIDLPTIIIKSSNIDVLWTLVVLFRMSTFDKISALFYGNILTA